MFGLEQKYIPVEWDIDVAHYLVYCTVVHWYVEELDGENMS